jgi:DNA polymerase III delta prime subunit
LETIVTHADGDLRTAINCLEFACSMGTKSVTEQEAIVACDIPNPLIIEKILGACFKGDITNAVSNTKELWAEGYRGQELTMALWKAAKNATFITDPKLKLRFLREIGLCQTRVSFGVDEDDEREPTKDFDDRVVVDTLLQITGLLGKLCNLK